MKIEKILEGDRAYNYMERYVNVGSRTYSSLASYIDVSPEYQPMGDNKHFEVPLIEVPKDKVGLHTSLPTEELLKLYVNDDSVLFAIHPEIILDDSVPFMSELKTYPTAGSIKVSPTASSRTVMSFEETNERPYHFLKLHYPKRISRFSRRHKAGSVEQGVLVSRELETIVSDEFAFLAKSIGITFGSKEEGWGYSVREYVPRPYVHGKRFLIPFFALYSGDLYQSDDIPLLVQMIEKLGVDAEPFVLEKIMHPLIKTWCHVNNETGLILAPHGQNVLLEIDENLMPQRIVHRDFVVYVDTETRKEQNLHLNYLSTRLLNDYSEREKVYSLIYDSFIGHHLFDYLSQVLEQFFSVSPAKLQESCKTAFHQYYPNAQRCFSNRTFYYSNEVLANNNYQLVETQNQPKWR